MFNNINLHLYYKFFVNEGNKFEVAQSVDITIEDFASTRQITYWRKGSNPFLSATPEQTIRQKADGFVFK
jgi:hypothetical protein